MTYILDGECYLNDDGNLVTIGLDCDCESPREWEYNMGTFYTWMHNHMSPDDNDFDGFDDLGASFGITCDDNPGQFITKFNEKVGVCMPVYAIVHSGTVYHASWSNPFHDPWDSGFVGVIFATKERIRELRCVKRVTKKVRHAVVEELMSEVELYSEWAEGSCYGFTTYDKNGDEVDSCWGFIGCDADKSGLAEECGGLKDCEYRSLDEFLEAVDALNELENGAVDALNELTNEVLDSMTAQYEQYAA